MVIRREWELVEIKIELEDRIYAWFMKGLEWENAARKRQGLPILLGMKVYLRNILRGVALQTMKQMAAQQLDQEFVASIEPEEEGAAQPDEEKEKEVKQP